MWMILSLTEPWFYIVMLGVAAIIYSLLIPAKVNAGILKTNQNREIEVTLEQYMAEFENENQELIKLITQMKQEFTSKQLAAQEQVVELRNRLVAVEQAMQANEARLVLFESNSVQTSVTQPMQPSTQEAVLIERLSEVAASENVSTFSSSPEEEVTVVNQEEPENLEDSFHNRYPELFELYDQGKSIDMIAKAVGIQRGEVQLILQLAKKEESR